MKKPTRQKLSTPAIQTRAEMEGLVGDICAATIKQDSLLAAMDDELQIVRARYEASLAEVSKSLDAGLALAQDWAEAHPSEFGKQKSIEMLHGVVGWRTGTPKAKTLAGWTWDRVLSVIVSIPKFAKRYARISEEVNKEALIADRELLAPEELREIGVRIVQDETFFVQPKREEAPATEAPKAEIKEAA